MKKINKLLSIIICALLVIAPIYVNAEENDETTVENETTTPSPSPTTTPEPTTTPTPSQTPETEPESTTTPTPSPSPTTTPEPSPEITKTIKLNKTSLTLDSGETATLTATTNPSNATVTWVSSNKEIATVDANGKVKAIKSGKVTITAKIKDDETISATCTVEIKTTPIVLNQLIINNGQLSPEFNPDVTEYTVSIQRDISKLKYQYETLGSGTFFAPSDSANKNLENGDILKFVVGDKTYKLTIVKDELNLNLKSLEINGYAFNEIFKSTKLEYTANIPYEIETITINAVSEDSDVTISGTGTKKDLVVGENTFKVTVKNGEGDSQVYKIVVTRDEEKEVEEKPTSIITSTNTSENNSNPANKNDSNNSSDSFLKYAIVSLACLILFAIGGIGIYFYLKTSPKKLRKELIEQNKEQEEQSPIVEVENSQPNTNNIENMMNENLVETREFKQEDLIENQNIKETENLFDDSEDV